MRGETKEIIKLSSKELIKTLFDVPFAMLVNFERGREKIRLAQYLEERSIDRQNFTQKIYHLKKKKLINIFVENKEKYVELTAKGAKQLAWNMIDKTSVIKPAKWDGLFRVVMFDVPEKKHQERDIFRRKIENIGFRQIQKSVFAFPFECKKLIDLASEFCSIKQHVRYMISNILEGESDIIEQFLDEGILVQSDLVKPNK